MSAPIGRGMDVFTWEFLLPIKSVPVPSTFFFNLCSTILYSTFSWWWWLLLFSLAGGGWRGWIMTILFLSFSSSFTPHSTFSGPICFSLLFLMCYYTKLGVSISICSILLSSLEGTLIMTDNRFYSPFHTFSLVFSFLVTVFCIYTLIPSMQYKIISSPSFCFTSFPLCL